MSARRTIRTNVVLTSLLLLLSCASLLFLHTNANAQVVNDSLSRLFVQELNAMRANPKAFIPQIDAYQRQLQSFTHNKKALSKAVKEIKKILNSQAPLSALEIDTALLHACADHLTDGAAHGFVGHYGSDSSNPGTRAARYGKFVALSEAITYGHLSTNLMLAAFLVDEGTPSRGHRIAMLSPDYTLVGAACGPHPTYNSQIVVLFGKR